MIDVPVPDIVGVDIREMRVFLKEFIFCGWSVKAFSDSDEMRVITEGEASADEFRSVQTYLQRNFQVVEYQDLLDQAIEQSLGSPIARVFLIPHDDMVLPLVKGNQEINSQSLRLLSLYEQELRRARCGRVSSP